MRRLGQWWVVWLVMLCGGCAFGQKFNYHDTFPRLDARGTGDVVVATHDQRPYIVSGSTPPDFVGLMRSGFGIPYPVYTQGERPFAEEMTHVLCQALTQRGFHCLPATVVPQATPGEIRQALTRQNPTPALFLTVREWKSDTHTDTSLAYNATLRVLDAQGAVLAESHIEGKDVLGGNLWNTLPFAHQAIPQAVQRKLETLLNDPAMTTALQALNQSPGRAQSVTLQTPARAVSFVSSSSSPPSTPQEGVRLQAQYDAFRLFLQPNTGAERLSQVSSSAVLKVLENRGSWLYVETPDQRRGWILHEWIEQ
jgi:Bacterial SH3 domain